MDERTGRRQLLLGAVLIAGMLSARAGAADDLQPRVPPSKPSRVLVAPGRAPRWVVVKFAEGTEIRLRGGRLRSAVADVSAADAVLAAYGVSPDAIRRFFPRPEADLDADRARGQRLSRRQLADLNLYYRVQVPPGTDVGALCDGLNGLALVELAEPEAIAIAPPADIAPLTPDFAAMQGHLDDPPVGIGAHAVAGRPGADGAGTAIVDVEYTWRLDHEDLELLPAANIDTATLADPFPEDQGNHGTAVLGVLGASDNDYGTRGIVPATTLMVAPANTAEYGYAPARAINLASGVLAAGDVILLEQQHWVCGVDLGPIEEIQSVFDAIAHATALGIVVVEAAGNGGVWLDDPSCGGRYDRRVRDSGAIIVGAGSPDLHERLWFSTYGSRIDVQGWGWDVVTTGYGGLFDPGDPRQRYTGGFNGTSSASPIVAGAVLSLQGIRLAAGLAPLDADAMRTLLRDTGTPQAGTDSIGPLPNLILAAQASLACGNGVIDVGETCDDGNGVNDDGCPATCRQRCPETPAAGCQRPAATAQAEVVLRNLTSDAGDLLQWRWVREAATSVDTFGDPGADGYQLCVYDQDGRRPVTAVNAPAGASWRAKSTTGFRYSDRTGSSNGLAALDLRAGARSHLRLTAKGANLDLPELSTLTLPIRVQLRSNTGACWETSFSDQGVKVHEAVIFRATSD